MRCHKLHQGADFDQSAHSLPEFVHGPASASVLLLDAQR